MKIHLAALEFLPADRQKDGQIEQGACLQSQISKAPNSQWCLEGSICRWIYHVTRRERPSFYCTATTRKTSPSQSQPWEPRILFHLLFYMGGKFDLSF
jgi:hypothetical protein